MKGNFSLTWLRESKCGFTAVLPHAYAWVAQMVEREIEALGVIGSIPVSGTMPHLWQMDNFFSLGFATADLWSLGL